MFSSKITSYVTFPIDGLDLQPYVHKGIHHFTVHLSISMSDASNHVIQKSLPTQMLAV